MADLIKYVDARFGGEPVRFRLKGGGEIEEALDRAVGSPFAALQRFGTGTWQVVDVRAVLNLAHPAAHDGLVSAGRVIGRPVRIKGVDDLLNEAPIGRYAPLAAKILEAFLVGLPPDRATFDEADPFPAEMTRA